MEISAGKSQLGVGQHVEKMQPVSSARNAIHKAVGPSAERAASPVSPSPAPHLAGQGGGGHGPEPRGGGSLGQNRPEAGCTGRCQQPAGEPGRTPHGRSGASQAHQVTGSLRLSLSLLFPSCCRGKSWEGIPAGASTAVLTAAR